MNFWTYLGIDEEKFGTEYVETGLVDASYHEEFPLAMFTYGRKATHDNVWDGITTKCRGIIVNTDTDEIVARPFEKFFNLGTADRPETTPEQFMPLGLPAVYEKMDGFLCTMYEYNGEQRIASKGSFTSLHAKWATSCYKQNNPGGGKTLNYTWPIGYTPVFEGITPNIRIVVDYGSREGLTLLALVNKETGEEMSREELCYYAAINDFDVPRQYAMTWQEATIVALTPVTNFEGYVLVWPRVGQPPFRVKVKYLDYLRLHRMVTCTSPKYIFKILSGEEWSGEMDNLLNDSTPWFNAYVKKWKNALELEFKDKALRTDEVFTAARKKLAAPPFGNNLPTRKEWATEFTKDENKDIAGALFGTLDGKDITPILWKLVKPTVRNAKPLVDARFV